jgi:hypothetical protein
MLTLVVTGVLLLARPAAAPVPLDAPRSARDLPRGVAQAAGDSLPGVAMTCGDFRGGEAFQVQGQHVLADGSIDAAWSPGGLLCLGSTHDVASVRVRDGSGGALVVWADRRMGHADVYAQRLTASGEVAPGWSHDGVTVCARAGDQDQIAACADGAGGAIVVWQDYRAGERGDLYAQRITSDGQLAWLAGGVAVCTDSSDQAQPSVCADGAGGALLVWQDDRSDAADLMAARLTASGTVTVLPAALVGAPGAQRNPRLAPDAQGGAYLAWEDGRAGSADVRLLRLDLSGAVWSGWPAQGALLGGGRGDQILPVLAVDDSAHALVAWCDRDSGQGDIRAQRIGPGGELRWGEAGARVCVEPHDQYAPALVAAHGGGAIVAWEDTRGSRTDVWVQRITATGEPAWAANGVALCRLDGDQFDVSLAADPAGGAYALWRDATRPARASFASRLQFSGPVPQLHHTEVGPGRAQVVYRTEPGDARSLRFERRLADAADWSALATVSADAEGMIIAEDRTVAPGNRAHYRLAILLGTEFVLLEEVTLDIPLPMPLALRFSTLEEGGHTLRVALTLATHDEATIDVIDLQGRRVLRRRYVDLGAGEHDVRMPFRAAPGVYFLRLTQGHASATGRLAVIR